MVRDAVQFPGVLLRGEVDNHRVHRQLPVWVVESGGRLQHALRRAVGLGTQGVDRHHPV
jgi:hypothetical protein